MIKFTEKELNYVKEQFNKVINYKDADADMADYFKDLHRQEADRINILLCSWSDINTDQNINELFSRVVYNVLGFWAWESFNYGYELREFVDDIFVGLWKKIMDKEEE